MPKGHIARLDMQRAHNQTVGHSGIGMRMRFNDLLALERMAAVGQAQLISMNDKKNTRKESQSGMYPLYLFNLIKCLFCIILESRHMLF